MYKKENFSKIKQYIKDGWVDVQSHPYLPLKIYNYSRTCAFEKHWDEITLQCRGLILDNEGNVVARSFPKFFNFEEINPSDYPFNEEHCYVTVKEDGSLIILFNYNGEWIFASKGSFTSDQALKAQEIFNKKYNKDYLMPGVSYIFEIMYPENRIVVNYGEEEKLVLLSMFDGYKEKKYTSLYMAATVIGCPYVHLEKLRGIQSIEALNQLVNNLRTKYDGNSEGFVIRFHPSDFRMKIKYEEYVRLHRLLTNFSNVDIWEMLKNNEDIKGYLDNVPDEFDVWVKDIINDLKQKYSDVEEDARNYYVLLRTKGYSNKAKKAKWIQKHVPRHLHSIIFSMIDKRDYSRTIWKMIRPIYSKPLWQTQTVEA